MAINNTLHPVFPPLILVLIYPSIYISFCGGYNRHTVLPPSRPLIEVIVIAAALTDAASCLLRPSCLTSAPVLVKEVALNRHEAASMRDAFTIDIFISDLASRYLLSNLTLSLAVCM